MVADVAAPAQDDEAAGSDATAEETTMAPQPAIQDTLLLPGSGQRDAEELDAYAAAAANDARLLMQQQQRQRETQQLTQQQRLEQRRRRCDGIICRRRKRLCGAHTPRRHRWRSPGDGSLHGCTRGAGHRGIYETVV